MIQTLGAESTSARHVRSIERAKTDNTAAAAAVASLNPICTRCDRLGLRGKDRCDACHVQRVAHKINICADGLTITSSGSVLVQMRCRHPACPTCGQVRRSAWRAKLQNSLHRVGGYYYQITATAGPTIAATPSAVSQRIDLLSQTWRKLGRQKRLSITGYLRGIESVADTADPDRINTHLHALVVTETEIAPEALEHAWRSTIGYPCHVRATALESRTDAADTGGYASKSGQDYRDEEPRTKPSAAAWNAIILGSRSRRLIETQGTIRAAVKEHADEIKEQLERIAIQEEAEAIDEGDRITTRAANGKPQRAREPAVACLVWNKRTMRYEGFHSGQHVSAVEMLKLLESHNIISACRFVSMTRNHERAHDPDGGGGGAPPTWYDPLTGEWLGDEP